MYLSRPYGGKGRSRLPVVRSNDEGVSIQETLEMVEVKGYVGAVGVTNAMVKSANVSLAGNEEIGAGYATVLMRNDAGTVEAVIDMGASTTEQVGELISVHAIPHPHNDIEKILLT